MQRWQEEQEPETETLQAAVGWDVEPLGRWKACLASVF